MVKHRDRYVVESIKDRKVESGHVLYLIKWKDYPDEESTWEPTTHLKSCKSLISDFEKCRRNVQKTEKVSQQLQELIEKSEEFWEKKNHEEEKEVVVSGKGREIVQNDTEKEAQKVPQIIEKRKRRVEKPVLVPTNPKEHKSRPSRSHLETWYIDPDLSPEKVKKSTPAGRYTQVVGCFRDFKDVVQVKTQVEGDGIVLVSLPEMTEKHPKMLIDFLIARFEAKGWT